MNLKLIIFEKGKTQTEIAKKLGIDKYEFNGFVKYKYIPTPIMLTALCNELQCKPLDIYQKNELYITLENKPVEKRKAKTEQDTYHLTVRLPKSRCNSLQQPQNLHRLGYINLTDFIWQAFLKFEKDLATLNEIEKRKEKKQ